VIPKYRKQAVVRVVAGFLALFAAFAVLVFTERTPQKNFGQMIAILLAIGGYLTYVFGCTAWAKAKGYSSSVAIGLIILGMVCFLLSSFILPPVVLFILEDKTLGYRRHSRHSRWLRWIK
jgi:Mn2+/Fe2+ NRAMP family transporter